MSRQIGIDHFADHFVEADFGLPTQLGFRLGRIAKEDIDLGRSHEAGIDLDIFVRIQTHAAEGRGNQILDAGRHPGGDDIVVSHIA